jgi:hypothetical protein
MIVISLGCNAVHFCRWLLLFFWEWWYSCSISTKTLNNPGSMVFAVICSEFLNNY